MSHDDLKRELKPLKTAELQKIILSLAKDPYIGERIDALFLAREEAAASPAGVMKRTNDLISEYLKLRRRHIFEPADELTEGLRLILYECLPPNANAVSPSKLRTLEACTSPVVIKYEKFNDGGDLVDDFMAEVSMSWVRALLLSPLPDRDRAKWTQKLTDWYGFMNKDPRHGFFEEALWTAKESWRNPGLQSILDGTSRNGLTWSGKPDSKKRLVTALLDVLRVQAKSEEALRLAIVEGTVEQQVFALARVGRVGDAVALARENLADPREMLGLCRWLRGEGFVQDAMKLAEVRMYSSKWGARDLALWLRSTATEEGDFLVAARAGEHVVRLRPTLEDYKVLEGIAVDNWPAIRQSIFSSFIERSYGLAEQVDILLYEQQLEPALKLAQSARSFSDIHKVVDAALELQPQLALQVALEQAELSVAGGGAMYYRYAVQWLSKAKTALSKLDREKDWQPTYYRFRSRHKPKWSLIEMLEDEFGSPF